MLYSEIKRETLGHINRYSVAGTPVAASYNNQADYLNRIPTLINEALVNIRTLVKPEPVVLPLVDGEDYAGMVRYELPEDFWHLRTGGVTIVEGDRFERTNQYRLQGKKSILVPRDLADKVTVEYFRYPDQLPLSPADDYELSEDLEVIQTATYYAAANLVMREDEFAYATLYNDYESRLGRITTGVTAEVAPVEDVYSFNAGWY